MCAFATNNLNIEFKIELKNLCVTVINNKIAQLNNSLAEVTDAANNETKSSAGDKHETGRAMMQLEQEKLSKQLSELESQKNELIKLNVNSKNNNITSGTLINTSEGMFFIAVSIGKIVVHDQDVMVISPLSPIGKLLCSSKTPFELNNKQYQILSFI